MKMNTKILRVLMVAALFVFGLSSIAQAEVITLDVANANLATQGSGPYGQYDITKTGDYSFQVVATGLSGFVFGNSHVVGLNITSDAGTVTFGSASNCLLAGGSTTCGFFGQINAGQVDGFGTFSFVVDDGNGFSNGGYEHFTFTFTTANNISLDDLLVANGRGATAVGHLALATNTACTGYAADSGTSSGGIDNGACVSTPEPGSMTLLALGLLGLVGAVNRKLSR